MISVKDVQELFGKRAAKVAFIIILASFLAYTIVDISTDNTISDRVRNYFRPPIAVNHLWQYQAPPKPSAFSYAHSGTSIDTISIDVPLRIVNKSNQTIFIENIKIQWKCLANYSDYEKYDELVASNPKFGDRGKYDARLFGQQLKKSEGGTLEGYPFIGVRYKDEVDLQNDVLNESKNIPAYIYFPLRLNPYEEVISRFYFQLNVVTKADEKLYFTVEDEKAKEVFVMLLPIFFGATHPLEGVHPVLLTFETNQGVFTVPYNFRTPFVAYRPDEAQPEVKEEKVNPTAKNRLSKSAQ